jgi:hypothetical protein
MRAAGKPQRSLNDSAGWPPQFVQSLLWQQRLELVWLSVVVDRFWAHDL